MLSADDDSRYRAKESKDPACLPETPPHILAGPRAVAACTRRSDCVVRSGNRSLFSQTHGTGLGPRPGRGAGIPGKGWYGKIKSRNQLQTATGDFYS